MNLNEARNKLAELSTYPVEHLPDYLDNALFEARLHGTEVIFYSDNGRAFSQDIHITWNFDDEYEVWGDNSVSQISI